MPLDEHQYEVELRSEGFTQVYVWEDAPDSWYPDQSKPKASAYIVLEGEMTVTIDGKSRTCFPGQRCDVPKGVSHSTKMGPEGCRYVVGEK